MPSLLMTNNTKVKYIYIYIYEAQSFSYINLMYANVIRHEDYQRKH